MQLGPTTKQKLAGCCPFLGSQVEDRSPVSLRGDAAVAWHDVRRITRVPSRGVDAELVLEIQVCRAQPVVITKTQSLAIDPFYALRLEPAEPRPVRAWRSGAA